MKRGKVITGKLKENAFYTLFNAAGLNRPRFNIGLAPMYTVTSPSLITAVLNGGGFAFHGLGNMSANKVAENIQAIYQQTGEEVPFGVNVFAHTPEEVTAEQVKNTQDSSRPFWRRFSHEPPEYHDVVETQLTEQIDVVLSLNVRLVSCTFGLLPQNLLERLKNNGIKIGATINNTHEAALACQHGYDFLIAQSSGAGGHLGGFSPHYSWMTDSNALVKNCRKVIGNRLPIIAAGGIRYGQDYLSAFFDGANAVVLGTQFIVTEEAEVEEAYKLALLGKIDNIDPYNTHLNQHITGRWVRGLPTRLFTESHYWNNVMGYPHMNYYLRNLRKWRDAELSTATFWSGQSVVRPELNQANRIPETIFNEALEILEAGHDIAAYLKHEQHQSEE